MDLKVGDKVKFLNSKGGGIVNRILDSRMVSVTIEGGFELPTLISEVIKIEPEEAGARFFDEPFDVPAIAPKTPEIITEDEKIAALSPEIIKNRKTESIFLAFIPHDQKWLITGLLDVLLINHTTYDIIYNLFLKNESGDYKGKDYGSVFPDSSLLLDTIDRESLAAWSEGSIQFLFHKNTAKGLFPPFNAEFRISGKKFYQEGNYRESHYFPGKGITVKIVSLTDYLKSVIRDKEMPGINVKEGELIHRHQAGPREAEVDLHIHELVDEESYMEQGEILEFQKNYFEQCLQSALVNHFLKVTFIHGVGNGVLRETLLGMLKNYEGIEVTDAPMAKYGMGAIEIRIPHNA